MLVLKFNRIRYFVILYNMSLFYYCVCQAFPNHRDELDHYEAIIVDLYNIYGERFYEYQKLFFLRSANALAVHKIKVNWSVRDRDLVQLIA